MNCFTMALDCKSFINVIKTFNPANQNLKKILMKKLHLYSGNNNLAQIHVFPNPLIVAQGRKILLLEHNFPHFNYTAVYMVRV